MRGRYLVLEGIDGAGTTTLLSGLSAALKARDIPVFLAAQPSSDGGGKMARKLLKQPLEAEHERAALALFFAADRLELRNRFEPLIADGVWVLCDRSVLSSLVYQGSELDEEWVAQINRFALPADLTFLLDLPASEAWARITSRSDERERFESPDRLASLRRRYLDTAASFSSPVRLIQASQSPEAVLETALHDLRERNWIS
jgi:dTMP kinase